MAGRHIQVAEGNNLGEGMEDKDAEHKVVVFVHAAAKDVAPPQQVVRVVSPQQAVRLLPHRHFDSFGRSSRVNVSR